MIDAALGVLDVDVSDCVMVGDRLYTDIRMATNAGMASALVLTGETTLDSLSGCPVEDQPRYILDQIDHLVPALRPLTL